MNLTQRPYQGEGDYWGIRTFLREVMLSNQGRERSWPVARFDYWRWHGIANMGHGSLEHDVFLWQTSDGHLAGVLNPEGPGEVYLQVHPRWRTVALEEAMIAQAETTLARSTPAGARSLRVWADAYDDLRHEVLIRHGYQRVDEPEQAEVTHRRRLAEPLPTVRAVNAYTIRSLGDGLELLERCYASGLGFHANDIRIAVDNRNDPSWYRNIQTAPLYRRDLDLVAVAPDGAIAAFCTIWFDDVTRSAYFEPVATVPAHQRRGLARAVMHEGLHRLQRLGATSASVGGYSQAANALYATVMGPDHDVSEPWAKTIQ
jgi:GNAT superfamily N-acetyltransferase